MKRKLILLVLLILFVTALAVSVSAAPSGTCGDNLTWTLDGDGTLTVSGTGAMYNYTSSKGPWYSYRDQIQQVVIGNGVTYIGDEAFFGCSNMRTVSIPESVYTIGRYAFASSGLQELVIPAGVSYIDYGAFDYCETLRLIRFMGDAPIPEPLPIFEEVSANAFYPKNNATWTDEMMESYGGYISWHEFTPYEVTGTVGDGLKWSLKNGTLTVSGSGSMGKDTYTEDDYEGTGLGWREYRDEITRVIINEGVTNVSRGAFDLCFNLIEVSLPESLTSIGYAAFGCCDSLRTIRIPSKVTKIWDHAFDDSRGMNEIVFTGNAPWFGESCFYFVEATVYYPANNSTWPDVIKQSYGGRITWVPYNAGFNYNGLVEVNGVWGYYKNGVLQEDYTGLVLHGDGYFYVRKGILDWSFFGIVYADGYYRYIENGMITWQYTGLASMNGEYYFVQNSTINWNYTGLVLHNGTYYYIQNGHLDWSYFGLAYLDGYWRYIENGYITWNYTGLAHMDGEWYYVENSTLDWSYTGLVAHNGTYYYVQNSHLDWSFWGLIYADGYWRYIENGMLTWNYTGLAQMNGEYFYVVNSTLDWGYIGLIEHSGALYYIHSGHLDWSYIGLGYHQGSWLYIYGGMYKAGYDGLVFFNNAWFYVEDSKLTWSHFGLYKVDGTLYYLNYSQIDWGFNGTATYEGKVYTVVNGVAVVLEKGLVGIAMPTVDLRRWKMDGENMRAQLEALGYTVDLQYADNDILTQVYQINNMIARGCEVLVIACIDGESLKAVLAEAKAADIPVIAYDRLIMGSNAVSYYTTFDNWDVGVKQGEYIVEALNLKNAAPGTTYNIEYVTGAPDDSSIHYFFDGAMSVLQPYIDAGILVTPSGQTKKYLVTTQWWATEYAQARFENILGNYYSRGRQLHAVLASNDSTAQGVVNALASSYTGKYPVITGQDCDLAAVRNIISGKQSMSVFKDTQILATQTVKMVDAIMNGNRPPINDTETYDNGTGVISSFLCEPVVCTKDNYWELLFESGYYTIEDLV